MGGDSNLVTDTTLLQACSTSAQGSGDCDADREHAALATMHVSYDAPGSSSRDAVQMDPDRPQWSFVSASLTGSREVDACGTQAFEESFMSMENTALRAPAKKKMPARKPAVTWQSSDSPGMRGEGSAPWNCQYQELQTSSLL